MSCTAASETLALSTKILDKAREYGADLAGFAAVAELKQSPSVLFSEYLATSDDPALTDVRCAGLSGGPVTWPEGAKSVLTIGIHHPADSPEMDWWFGSADPPGNRLLAKIVRNLCFWISENLGIAVYHLPYHIDKGGIYLKDAAVLSGMGCIGKNNLLLTPEYGPQVRLRALTLGVDIASTSRLEFDPCTDCQQWCQKACPQHALSTKTSFTAVPQDHLTGRDGSFSRKLCDIQMEIDRDNAQEQTMEDFEAPVKLIKYCRRCEFSCPVGKLPPG